MKICSPKKNHIPQGQRQRGIHDFLGVNKPSYLLNILAINCFHLWGNQSSTLTGSPMPEGSKIGIGLLEKINPGVGWACKCFLIQSNLHYIQSVRSTPILK
jgi:hypothetical protein